MMTNKRLQATGAALLLTLALGACGGSDNDNNNGATPTASAGASDTFFTPNVDFNESTGKCVIAGESYLENTVEFYKELQNWLKEYFNTKKAIDFHFSLTYFNTSSSKALLQLMNSLKAIILIN